MLVFVLNNMNIWQNFVTRMIEMNSAAVILNSSFGYTFMYSQYKIYLVTWLSNCISSCRLL